MKNYQKPQIQTILLSNDDILNGSDTLIDASTLFDDVTVG